jgi:hypothetical protein
VLAVVGPGRTITRTGFLRGWQDDHLRQPADSLTLPAARKFLELLVDRELLAEAASREAWAWTPEETARLGMLADRLALSAALDSAMGLARVALEAANPGAPAPDAERVGMAARDSAMSRFDLRLDDALLERLTAAWRALPRPRSDSSVASQLRTLSAMPEVAADDTGRVVARSSAGDYRVTDLMGAWRRLSPVYRPRIEAGAQLVDLIRNGLFERLLRAEAARRRLAERPDIVATIARERESMAISHYVRREVTDRLTPDPASVQRYFRAHSAEWALPTRVRAIRLSFDTRGEAALTAMMLRGAAAAESIVARAHRAGLEYRVEVSAESDSSLFALAERAGTGAVIGPTQDGKGWSVARIEALLPGRGRELEEVRGEVEAHWLAEESERRLAELCARLARRSRPTINDQALRRVVETGS